MTGFEDTAYTPDGDGLFDVGNTTGEALRAVESGTPAEDAGPTHEQANGNGSLMRILPLALVDHDISNADLIEGAHRASRVTHGTLPAQVACAVYSIIVRRLLKGRAIADGDRRCAPNRPGDLRDGREHPHVAALDDLEWISGASRSGYRVGQLLVGVGRVRRRDDYRETIQRAVAYGNDTDTTAAIAGGLAGVRWGIGGIP